MNQKPYLNLGCGRIILPAPRPVHHSLINEGIYAYPLWHNVDRNPEPGVDECLDIFRYPWPWEDNSFDGALVAHVAEHIPHEIRLSEAPPHEPSAAEIEDYRSRMDVLLPTMKRDDPHRSFEATHLRHAISPRAAELASLQDGWYAFFAELYRVLTPSALIHVLSPYAWSHGGITDPTHTRLLTPESFLHSMQPNPDAPFAYATGGLHLELVDTPRYAITPEYQPLMGQTERLYDALAHHINVASEFAVTLRVVK